MSKITKKRKRRKNTVQYRKNPRKNFFPEDKKGGGKIPLGFFSSAVNSVAKKQNVENYKKLEKNLKA